MSLLAGVEIAYAAVVVVTSRVAQLRAPLLYRQLIEGYSRVPCSRVHVSIYISHTLSLLAVSYSEFCEG